MNKKVIAKLCIACLVGGQVFSTIQAKENGLNSKQILQTNWQKAQDKTQNMNANVKEPALKSDFSNVINFDQYTGFTKEQLELLRKNGFVVIPQNTEYAYLKMYQSYEEAEYDHTPIFISTDAVLNMYHIFYGDSLKMLETSELYPAIKSFSTMMLEDSLAEYNSSKNATEKAQLKKIVIYYTVASLLSGSSVAVPNDIKQIADKEIALIEKASGITNSPLLGRKVDYSQYTVRGYYDNTEMLRKYFKTMMWYGQIGFVVMDEKGNINLDNAKIAAYMSLLSSKNANAHKLWQKVYTATSAYVGEADDLSPTEFEKMITKVYGKNITLKNIGSPKYDKALTDAIKALPSPKIVAKMQFTTGTVQGKQFRMMGQRYTLDADVIQQLIEPEIRPESSGLDVMAALGSTRARALAEQYENPNGWKEYSTRLKKAEGSIKAVDEKTWNKNMYNGWLSMLQSQLTSFEGVKGMPRFMQTQAWTDKSIVGALGSYAELKHDTVLYSKQACAERGGPDEIMPYIYVEPNVEVYSKLLNLLVMTAQSLNKIGAMNEDTKNILDEMITYVKTMKACAIKELNNETFTEEEYYILEAFGGMVDRMSRELLILNRNYDSGISETYTSALISDISTIADTGECVEVGTGIPYNIYVICPYNGKLFLAKGSVFSYYEFASAERLTDEKWHKMLGIEKKPIDGHEFEVIRRNPNANGCKAYVPEWTTSYISKDVDHVQVQAVEVNWDGAYK